MVWNPNIWNEAKKAGTIFKKGESWNLNWRPRKWISLVNKELAEQGYAPATRQDIEENYMQLLQLKQEELVRLWKDDKQPMLVRVIAKAMLSWKWFDVIEKMLDRGVWKATQPVIAQVQTEVIVNPLQDRLNELWLS